ncbi:MAG: hypothetical protein AB8I08_19440 [Sandaracinaceae bacterium]
MSAQPTPTPDEVAESDGDPRALGRAATQCARLAFVRQDPATLGAWRDAIERHAEGPALPLVDRQIELLEARVVEDAPLAVAEASASRAGLAPMVVDVAATRALAALTRDDLTEARHHARRAVRMSRTEELPLQQYLSGLVLARVRRFEHQPHMALRILTALRRVAPAALEGWLEHELRMAGEPSHWAPETPRLDIARARAPGAPSAYVRAEFELFIALLDPSVASAEADDWRSGRTASVPRGMLALEPALGEHHALVLLSPGEAMRVLASSSVAGVELVHSSRPGRLETALSVLALAPEPPTAEAFFEEVYGFAFEPAVHRGALEVLVHRLREMIGERAEITRDRGTIGLRVDRPFAVPDPRVKRSLDDAVLRSLAQRPGATAKESAAEAGAPLRSVQHVLKRLVEEGACEAEKRGRVVCYRVEDTTFTEPTRVLDWNRNG